MKYLFFALGLLSCVSLFAEGNAAGQLPFTWNALWLGSWEENKTLHNRLDMRLGLPLLSLNLRTQAIDRHMMNFEFKPPWGEPVNGVTNFSAGLYHRPTNSRLLYGPLDEWGLSARVRSPWIRSAPFAENRKPLMADLKTAVSVTKEPETYLYLSSPRLAFFPENIKPEVFMRGFASAQIRTSGELTPAFSGGVETLFGKKNSLLLEGFYTCAELPAKTSTSWFSSPPPLPERDFQLSAASLFLNTAFFSISSDWAYSETFALGRDIYGNVGIKVNPPPFGSPVLPGASGKKTGGGIQPGPWSISLAADGAGERFAGRDGSNPGAGFRCAGKFEYKLSRNGLFRGTSTFRGPGLGDAFNRSTIGLYYRFPTPAPAGKNAAAFPLHLTRVSLNTDRNATNTEKIIDGMDGALGFSLNLPPVLLPGFSTGVTKTARSQPKGYPLAINLSGSVKGESSSDGTPSPFPIPQKFWLPEKSWQFYSAKAACELSWSPGIFQFGTKWGYGVTAKKEGQWEASASAAARFRYGRLGIKAASPDFPDKWNCTVSWKLEKK